MSDVVANPQTTAAGESKSARKKKAKAGPAVPVQEKSASEIGSVEPGKTNGLESGENSYIKELQKQIRNINKKLNAMQKVDAIIETNPGVSLDDLVAARKINSDQRASALKKPTLQAQLQQIEEQITQYKKFAQEYEERIARQKEQLEAAHQEELEKLRETLKEEATQESTKTFRDKLLTLSRFLMAAATRRQTEEGGELSEAFEGALLAVYGGDAAAVSAMENLTEGTEDVIVSTQSVPLSITFAQVKQASLAEAPFAAEEAWVDDVAQSQAAAPEAEEPTTAVPTDPTIANAGMTEILAEGQQVGGAAAEAEVPSAPAAASIDAGAANAAAEAQWDKPASATDEPLAESFEMVPRNPSETETPAAAAPVSSVQSWADDAQESAHAAAPPGTAPNDGFSEVHHHRGGRGRGGFHGDSRGGFRGRGGPRGGDGRGRGGRGGRGRGDYRGGRGGFRGGPRGGETQPQQ